MAEQIESPGKIDYRALVLLSLGHMVADINSSALPAMLPFLKESLGLSYAMAGMIILVSSVTSSVIQPAFGYVTDKKSLLWFLPLGCFCAALGMSLVGWAGSYEQILFLVTFGGLGVAIYHPEGWRVANFFAGAKKATGMSIFAVGGNLGFAMGPLMATFFVKYWGLKGSSFFLIPGTRHGRDLSFQPVLAGGYHGDQEKELFRLGKGIPARGGLTPCPCSWPWSCSAPGPISGS